MCCRRILGETMKMKVGPFVYTIVTKKQDGIFGYIDFEKQKIYVDPRAPKIDRLLTQFHESLHAVVDSYGIRALKDLNPAIDEMVIRCLEMGVVNLIRDNPKFFMTLIKEFTKNKRV